MKRIRIGKDICIRWQITTDGDSIPLEGRDLIVEIKSPFRVVSNIPFRVDGNTIIMTYYGKEQEWVGEYSVTLWENKGKQGQNVVDAIKAFELVKTSSEENDFENGDIQLESIDLGTSNLEILSGGAPTTPGESPDLSALQRKVDANTTSISKISKELGNVKEVQTGHNNSIVQLNTTIEEHAERIAQLESGTSGGGVDSSDIAQINATLDEIKAEQTEQNSTLADHEERLVYTESDLVKVREEYDGIISELVKSIGHTQKAFVVETNDSECGIRVDGVIKKIPANSIKAFRFNNTFNTNSGSSAGIKSFRFFVTDTSEVTNMESMFIYCSSLKSIDLSGFDTSAVKNMNNMFYGCSSITTIDLSNFNTSAVTSMAQMFTVCSSLTSLDLSGFDTSSVPNMSYMFFRCYSLTTLDLSSFDTSAVTNMYAMFSDCSSLTTLDLSSFDTSAVTNVNGMFYGCSSLNSLLLGPNFFKTSAVTDIDFSSCGKWTNETVVASLVTNSYDRATAGLNTLTLKLHNNTKAALTDEQKATITSKGYTIA